MRTNADAAAYTWSMAQGPNPHALQRMRERFPLPRQPMGEAWFMGGSREMYDSLMVDAPERWPRDELHIALEALTSGPTSFGELPEWSEWFRFLLPRTVALDNGPRLFSLLEILASAVMIHRPDSEDWSGDYPQFRQDVLETLGRALFGPVRKRICRLQTEQAPLTVEHTTSGHQFIGGDLYAASVFLVAKYLPLDQLSGWLDSLVRIDDPLWRANWVVWLAQADWLVAREGKQPCDPPKGRPNASWQMSHCICGSTPSPNVDRDARPVPFLRPQRRECLLEAIRDCTSQGRLKQWRNDLAALSLRSEVDLGVAIWQCEQAAIQATAAYGLKP